ncbi:MAG: aminodeoxychorismate synthase component I [Cryobacterium sp.]|nr:aminodeoxychorismate synthase component I [Cryobacterium sp.]
MRRRVLVHTLESWVDPAAAFATLFADLERAFWLDSGATATTGMSYLGTCSRWLTASVAQGIVTEHPSGIERDGTIFETLSTALADPIETDPDAGAFQLGWVGWLGYELHAQTMGTGLVRGAKHPDAALAWVDRAIAFDHTAGIVRLLALGESWSGELAGWRETTSAALDRLPARLDRAPGATPVHDAGVEWADTDDEYVAKVRACQKAIREGDAYQLCLTTQARVTGSWSAADLYLDLRTSSPTHHGAYLRFGDVCLLSATPEQFLAITPERVIETKPIKGTRPRGRTTAEDALLHAELLGSDKERAENLMIVDLMRNDLGRVCEVGSVTVPSLLAVESYAHVHQLVSTVRGRLAEGVTVTDAVAACFPAGSMTGAPKLSAVTILDSLERRARGIYSGTFGYFSLDGRVDLAMVIRSIVLDADGATIGAGGGITALSVPEEELAEAKLKAAALLQILAG